MQQLSRVSAGSEKKEQESLGVAECRRETASYLPACPQVSPPRIPTGLRNDRRHNPRATMPAGWAAQKLISLGIIVRAGLAAARIYLAVSIRADFSPNRDSICDDATPPRILLRERDFFPSPSIVRAFTREPLARILAFASSIDGGSKRLSAKIVRDLRSYEWLDD